MMNIVLLPECVAIADGTFNCNAQLGMELFREDQMHAYAAAVSAAKGARIKVLEDALHGIFNTAGMHPVHQEQAIKRARAALVNKNG